MSLTDEMVGPGFAWGRYGCAIAAAERAGPAICAGDPEAVREVYRQCGGPVSMVALSIVANPEPAADVVQQTFVKAWRVARTSDTNREPNNRLACKAR